MFGIAILGVGIWAKVKFGDYAVLSESVDYATASNVLIAAGVIVALVAFFGCCGAWKENRLFLIIVSGTGCNRQSLSCLSPLFQSES